MPLNLSLHGWNVIPPLVLFAVGCFQTNSDDGSDAGPLPENINRTPTCVAYQRALCDYASNRCGQLPRDQCDADAVGLYCRSDSVVQKCIDALRIADCSALPESCDGVTDTAPAEYVCGRLANRICTLAAACGLVWADCEDPPETLLDCQSAIGIGPTVDACMLGLDSFPCPNLEAGDLPTACHNVVRF